MQRVTEFLWGAREGSQKTSPPIATAYKELLSSRIPLQYSIAHQPGTFNNQNALYLEMEKAVENHDGALLDDLIKQAKNMWNTIDRGKLLKQAITTQNLEIIRPLYERQSGPAGILKGLISEPRYLVTLTALAAAAGDSNIKLVSDCLNFVSPDAKLSEGLTILQHVRSQRNEKNNDCIKRLTVASWAAIGEFSDAIEKGENDTVKQLLDDGCNPNYVFEPNQQIRMTPLSLAIWSNKVADNTANVTLLLDHGADPDETIRLPQGDKETTPYQLACSQNKNAYVTLMTPKSKNALRWFRESMQRGDVDGCNFYLKCGLDQLIKTEELLKQAVQYHFDAKTDKIIKHGIEKIINILLTEYAANPDYTAHSNDAITDKQSAWALALHLGDEACLKQLTPRSTDAKNLMFTAAKTDSENSINNMTYFINHGGFDKNTVNEFHQTLLYIAASKGCDHVVDALLGLSVDTGVIAADGKSALNIALAHEHNTCVKLITEAAVQALLAAAQANNIPAMNKLLKQGVDADAALKRVVVDGEAAAGIKLLTPYSQKAVDELVVAGENNQDDMVTQLIEGGANTAAAMLKALNENKINCVKTLLRYVDPDRCISADNKSALTIAREMKNDACIQALTPYSTDAISELKGVMQRGEFARVEQLLKDGVNTEIYKSYNYLDYFKQYKYNIIENQHIHIMNIINADYAEQNDKWRNKEKGADHSVIGELEDEILFLDRMVSMDDGRDNFIAKLETLRDDLRRSINKQRPQIDEKSHSYHIARDTVNMLVKLRKPMEEGGNIDEYKKDQLGIIREYEDKYVNTSWLSKCVRFALMVAFAAVGFVLGAALGIWTGPGAAATAIMGGTVATAFFATSAFLLFKPWGWRKETGEVATAAKQFVRAAQHGL